MDNTKRRRAKRTDRDQRQAMTLRDMTYDYLVTNFHKFSQANKIKIALAIQSRVVVEHTGTVTHDLFLNDALQRAQDRFIPN